MASNIVNLSIPLWFEQRVRLFVFRKDDNYYIASTHKSTLDMENDPVIKDFIKDKRYVHIPMSFVVNDCESEYHAYLFVNVDCAFPPHYIVFADGESDALEEFLEKTDACLVEEPDLSDYDEDSLTYDCNGRPMDIQSLHYDELQPFMMIFE